MVEKGSKRLFKLMILRGLFSGVAVVLSWMKCMIRFFGCEYRGGTGGGDPRGLRGLGISWR
jgi:hypothetical protein